MQNLRLQCCTPVHEVKLRERFHLQKQKKLEPQLLAKQQEDAYRQQPQRARLAMLQKTHADRIAANKTVEERRANGWTAMMNAISKLDSIPLDAEAGLARIDALWEAGGSTAADTAALAADEQREFLDLQRQKKEAVEEIDRLKHEQGSAESRVAKDLAALRSAVEAKAEDASRLRERKALLEEKISAGEQRLERLRASGYANSVPRTPAAFVPNANPKGAAAAAEEEGAQASSRDPGEANLR